MKRRQFASLALLLGVAVGGAALSQEPAHAQERGTGVVQGGGGGGGGGMRAGGGGGGNAAMRGGGGGMRAGGMGRPGGFQGGMAPQGGGRFQGAAGMQGGGMTRGMLRPGRDYGMRQGGNYGRQPIANPGYQGGARALTVTPGQRFARGDGGRRWDGRRWRNRGVYGAGLGLAAASPFFYPGYGYNTYDPYYSDGYYDQGGYGPDYGYEPAYQAPVGGPYQSGPSYSYGSQQGNYCATPQKTCQLYQPAEVGIGCSCRAPSGQGRYRGTVVP